MKARQLISSASYGPNELRVLFAAFDQAWAVIAPKVGDDPGAIEATRLRLANIVLGLAGQGEKGPAWISTTALQLLTGGDGH